MQFTRRSLIMGSLGAAATHSLDSAKAYAIRNAAIEFRLTVAQGKVVSRRLTNRLSGETVSLPTADFELEFEHAPVLHASDFALQAIAQTGRIELLYGRQPDQVRVEYELPPARAYLRKRISLRTSAATGRRLLRCDLENWEGIERDWKSMQAADPHESHPIYCADLWAGVEFVAAFNQYGSDGFLLRSRPGGKRISAEWTPLHPTVLGVCARDNVKEAFLTYLDDLRLAPPRWVACYNSWWSLPKRFHHTEYLALMRELKSRLYDRHGVFFDLVTTDAGWNDRQAIWQIDRNALPDGLADMRTIVESAGGKPGLWMSPSEQYALNIDYEWARETGYTVVDDGAVSLADPQYREQTRQQLQQLIRQNDLGHVKFDGLLGRETVAHHDLLPGDDSVEPLAEYALELVDLARQVNPSLITEPTYASSPWFIRHSDTLFGNAGGDCPLGLWPAPDYRESHTNAREFFIFRSLHEIWMRQDTLQYFDIVQCDDGAGFANHAAMAVGRGRVFISSSINPKFMGDDDWRVYAELLRWGRQNTDILRNTTIVASRIDLGEPYVYAHWLGMRGILAVRNPSNQTQAFVLDLQKTGAPASLRDGVGYTQYPYRKGLAAGLTGNSTISLKLAPWELLYIEVQPQAELKEPVLLGARWFLDPQGRMSAAGEVGAHKAQWIDKQGKTLEISLPTRADGELAGTVLHQDITRAGSAVEWQLEYAITAPADVARTLILLLVEFPGREFSPSRCAATVNAKPVVLKESSSPGHNGYFLSGVARWAYVAQYESNWTWYIAELGPGSSHVRLSGSADFPQARLCTWAWAEWDLTRNAVPVERICPHPSMPQYRPEVERIGVRLVRT